MGLLINPYIFDTPAGGATDPHFGNVLALLNFETSITTNSAASGFTFTSTSLDLTTGKFGQGLHNASGSIFDFQGSASDDWELGTNDFTIECWIARDAAANCWFMFHASGATGWLFGIDGSGRLTTLFRTAESGTAKTITATSALPSGFAHVVFERAGTTFRLYEDGVMVGTPLTGVSAAVTPVTSAPNDFLRIGMGPGGVGNFFINSALNRKLDEIRVTRGTARYASNSGYTVPTAAFPTAGP